VVADSDAASAKTRAATPSSNEGEQESPVRMEVYEGVEFCLIGLGVALEEERQIPR